MFVCHLLRSLQCVWPAQLHWDCCRFWPRIFGLWNASPCIGSDCKIVARFHSIAEYSSDLFVCDFMMDLIFGLQMTQQPPSNTLLTKATRCIKRRSRSLEPRASIAPTCRGPQLIVVECIQNLVYWCSKYIGTTLLKSGNQFRSDFNVFLSFQYHSIIPSSFWQYSHHLDFIVSFPNLFYISSSFRCHSIMWTSFYHSQLILTIIHHLDVIWISFYQFQFILTIFHHLNVILSFLTHSCII